MGIRTLHRQTAPAQATTDATASTPAVHVPPFSAAASTPRIPRDLATTLRRAATDVRHRLTRRDWLTRRDLRLWADQARGYLALLLTAVPRSRPMRTMTVFIATAGTATHPRPREGAAPGRNLPGSPDAAASARDLPGSPDAAASARNLPGSPDTAAPARDLTGSPDGSAPVRPVVTPEPDATP